MDLYNITAGLVLIGGGLYAYLLATGRVEANAADPIKSKQWRERYGPTMKWAGPVVVVSGILHLLGIF